MPGRIPTFLSALAAAALLAACKPQAPPAGGAPPPPEVGVVVAEPRAVGLMVELPGRLEASRVAEVRARAAGIVQKISFREGSVVRSGQRLFEIDPAPYRAAYDSARASLARAEASLVQASALAERYRPLVETQAISKQEYINATVAQKLAEADVAAGKAAVLSASINLERASVTSPIAGRIGRALVTEGALVGQGEATPLARVQQIDPLFVNFTQSASEVLRLRESIASGRLKRAPGGDAVPVEIVLDELAAPVKGRLLFSDLTVDDTTGQIMLRAEIPNPQGLLLPGLYVRVRIAEAQASQAFLLPQQAVTRASDGDTVTIVDAEGKVTTRRVRVGGVQEGQWLVLDGLAAGEQVMVDGFQKLRGPGPVKAVPWKTAAASGPAQATPAGGARPASAAGAASGAAAASGTAAASAAR